MSETEWLAQTDPNALLTFLLWQGRISERKRRLFACACCRPFLCLAADERPRAALDAAEDHADGCTSAEALYRARLEAHRARRAQPGSSLAWQACRLAEVASSEHAYYTAPAEAARLGNRLAPGQVPLAEPTGQCSVLRDVAGSPFRAARIDPAWLTWNDATVSRLAHAIYRERVFYRLPILADALQEAGCSDALLLDHLRAGEVHTRGCWWLDLILGRR